jgi:hypothetical protein
LIFLLAILFASTAISKPLILYFTIPQLFFFRNKFPHAKTLHKKPPTYLYSPAFGGAVPIHRGIGASQNAHNSKNPSVKNPHDKKPLLKKFFSIYAPM